MYNGIGLATPRGSGTNGYVQRNLAFVKTKKERVDYKTEEELNKLDQGLNKQPNREILDHERKRKVELKCMEMQELMEEQGYSEKEVNDKVNMFRKMLMAKEGVSESSTVEKDEHGRPLAKETHQLAEANQEKNAKLKEAFGLSNYVEGSAFDPDRKAKEEAAKAAALAQKKYSMVASSDEGEGKEEGSPPQKKKKKKSRHDSTSPERSKEKRKKSRKHHKRDRYHSKKHRKSKHRSRRRSEGKKRSRRHHSSSSSGSDRSDSEDSDSQMVKEEPGISTSGTSTVNGSTAENHKDHQPTSLSTTSTTTSQPGSATSEATTTVKPSSVVETPSIPSVFERLKAISAEPSLSTLATEKSNGIDKTGHDRVTSRASRSRSRSWSGSHRSRSYKRAERRSRSDSSYSRSRSRDSSRSRSRSGSRGKHSHSRSHSRSRSRSKSSGSERRASHRDSRSPSIRRRYGSPSHLDKRRITSSSRHSQRRKYRRSSRTRSRSRSHSSSRSRSRSRSSSWSPSRTRRYLRRSYY